MIALSVHETDFFATAPIRQRDDNFAVFGDLIKQGDGKTLAAGRHGKFDRRAGSHP